MAILLSQKYVENLSDRSPCHARESGHPTGDWLLFHLPKSCLSPFRSWIPVRPRHSPGLAAMTSKSFKGFWEHPIGSITIGKLAILSVLLLLLQAAPLVLHAQPLPTAERQKIEALIKYVGDLKDTKFIRNGSSYDVSTAVRFLRGKWDANDAVVKTARDFIDKVASFSGTSGKPYLIRFKDGKDIPSREFLAAELQKIEAAPIDRRASGS